MVRDGPINCRWFQAYVDQVLVPELKPGDVVIIDNLGSHKGAGARRAIEAVGGDAALPPALQSRLQPDREGFAKLKAHLRKAAERSVDALWNRIGASLEEFTPKVCANFFAAVGYEPL